VHRDARQVLLAGHEPLFGRLAAYLAGAAAAQVEMRKAALARIDIDRFDPEPRGVLRWLLPPELV
jgi:phosphohistidine phosphatase